jgi:hypothetical protein
MDNMTDEEAEARATYIAAGMTEKEYETFEFFVSLRYALEDAGMDELATPLRTVILLIDRWTERERQTRIHE